MYNKVIILWFLDEMLLTSGDKKANFRKFAIGAIYLIFLTAAKCQAKGRPNIIFILADDLVRNHS